MADTCPICLSTIINSNYPIITLNCLHQMHEHCYMQLLKENILSCPVCKKFLPVGDERTEITEAIREMYMHHFILPEYDEVVPVICNDCGRKFCTQYYQYLYCPFCDLFNCEELSSSVSDSELIDANEKFKERNVFQLEITLDNVLCEIERRYPEFHECTERIRSIYRTGPPMLELLKK